MSQHDGWECIRWDASRGRGRVASSPIGLKPRVEPLEDRQLLAVVSVNARSGAG
jgi:hypothetical protein